MMLQELTDHPLEARKLWKGSKTPRVVLREECGRAAAELLDNGTFFYLKDGERIRHGFSTADTLEGASISTRTAALQSRDTRTVQDPLGEGRQIVSVYRENGLTLRQELTL